MCLMLLTATVWEGEVVRQNLGKIWPSFMKKSTFHTDFAEALACINHFSLYSFKNKFAQKQFWKPSTLWYVATRGTSVYEMITSLVMCYPWVWWLALRSAACLNRWHCNAWLVCDGAFGEWLRYCIPHTRGFPFSTGSKTTCSPEIVRRNLLGNLGIFMLLHLHLQETEIYPITGKEINFFSSDERTEKQRFLQHNDLPAVGQVFVSDTLNRLKLCVINDCISWPCARRPYVHLCRHGEGRQTASAVLLDLSQACLLTAEHWMRKAAPVPATWSSADVLWWFMNRYNNMWIFMAHCCQQHFGPMSPQPVCWSEAPHL